MTTIRTPEEAVMGPILARSKDRTVCEPNACQRLVTRLINYAEPKGTWCRLRTGVSLLWLAHKDSWPGSGARDLPVDGIKRDLVAHGQAGQFYRHLYFHIGCRFLGWPGMLASGFMHRRDIEEAAAGRRESIAEVRGNLAASECAEVLLDLSQKRISRRDAEDRLRQILAEQKNR